jgi:glycosyltransferase involved in cell wall biosynthesis
MTVAVDGYNLAGDRRGMGRVVRGMLARLHDLGVALVLVAKNDSDARALQREFPFPAIRANQLSAKKPDAVWYPWNGMRFTPPARAVVTIHDPFAFTYPHRNIVARYREQAPIRRAIAQADDIVAVSRWTASQLQRLFRVNAARLRVIPNGIDAFWHPVETPESTPYFFFLAGTDERKNAAMLFRAYDAAFAGAGPELVVGGALSTRNERLFEVIRSPKRRVTPGDEALRALYSGALAVLIPSLAEGYGLVAAEAMACGAPVLASDTSALPETCGDAAMLLACEPELWSNAIRLLEADHARRRAMRERSLERAAAISAQNPAEALLESLQRPARSL